MTKLTNPFLLKSELKYAVAVSGGSDSLAMLMMLVEFGYQSQITVLHFNHKLRPESEEEALEVEKICEGLGVPCIVGHWDDQALEGNLQQQARQARYSFFKRCCDEKNLAEVLVAHTQDDVVETMLMRLGRGSGLTGLSAMAERSTALDVAVFRPLLGYSREELQQYLADKPVDFISDPSNDNDKFFRIRVRKLKGHLHNAGLDYQHMASSAHALKRADEALEFFTEGLANQLIENKEAGQVALSTDLTFYPQEVQLRLLAKALLQCTGQGMAPRTSKRQQALQFMVQGVPKFTLGGAIFLHGSGAYIIEKQP